MTFNFWGGKGGEKKVAELPFNLLPGYPHLLLGKRPNVKGESTIEKTHVSLCGQVLRQYDLEKLRNWCSCSELQGGNSEAMKVPGDLIYESVFI